MYNDDDDDSLGDMDWSPVVTPTKPQLPAALATFFKTARHMAGVKFDAEHERFVYQAGPNNWKRAYGLTTLLRHAFWPDYDRKNPGLLKSIAIVKRRHYAAKKRKAKGDAVNTKPTKGSYTTAQANRMGTSKSRGPRGMELGTLVHGELHTWALDRYRGTHNFTDTIRNPHAYSLGIRAQLTRMGVDVRYGEFMIYHPQIPVATSIDLVGWSQQYRSIVLIEVKTGSNWDRDMGTGAMRTRLPESASDRRLLAHIRGLSNSPYHQAMAQLAVTHAIVVTHYNVKRVMGLVVWANQVHGVMARWLDKQMARVGKIMLTELQVHMQQRKGIPWAKPKARV